MRRRQWILPLVLAALFPALLLGCAAKSSVPKGFPADLPLPEGRMYVQPTHPDPSTVQFSIEAVDGTQQVVSKYEQQLAGGKWKRVSPGQTLFDHTEDADFTSVSDGVYKVDIIVTDLGSTTKVGFTAKKL
jgi:hypothetical protein